MPDIDPDKRLITNKELRAELQDMDKEIQKRPTSWEVRTLILIAVVANQLIPSLNLGPNPTQAAVDYIVGVLPL